jgi:hypothetical protein
MSAWSELERVALLGTRRERLELPQIAPALDGMLARIGGGDAGRELLGAAGALDLYEQIGRSPARRRPEMATPPAENQRPCPPYLAHFLAQMLEGTLHNLMPEFLLALRETGLRVPETLLPNMLAQGQRKASLRPLILPVLGRRGRWLAAHHPDWHYAAMDPGNWSTVRHAWENTSEGQRPSLVAQLREIDPAAGRALVESTWRGENDQRRLQLIRQLAAGLSAGDEPLLEAALDDRYHLVRRHAAELLAHLTESRLAARMQTYAPLYLNWTPRQVRQIAVSLPPVSAAMRRDGIVGVDRKDAAVVRSQEMIQLVSGIPLDYWPAAWQAEPRAIVRAIPTTAWPRTLTAGFSLAALRQKDAAWAELILDECGLSATTAKLVPVLSPRALRVALSRALALADVQEMPRDSDLVTILRRWPGPIESDLGEQLAAVFVRHFRATAGARSPGTIARDSFLGLARQSDPALVDKVAPLLADAEALGCWHKTAVEFLHILRFRRDMLAAIETASKQPQAANTT